VEPHCFIVHVLHRHWTQVPHDLGKLVCTRDNIVKQLHMNNTVP